MANEKILVIEDDEDILELIRFNLAREAFKVVTVNDGSKAYERISRERPALVVLDLMLPGLNGLEICKLMKHDDRTRHIPVIMVTAKGEESDVVIGLELGADDYIPKPFSPRVLLARVKAVLRRRESADEEDKSPITRGEIEIDPARYEVRVKGRRVNLTATEYGILHVLARKPGWVFTRYQIVDAVRGANYAVTERAVDFQMVGLRKKLGRSAHCIETVRGIGYRFKEA